MALRNLRPNRRSTRYTPTLVAVANVDGVPAAVVPFFVSVEGGKHVRVSGSISVDPTAAATLTRVGIPLPYGYDVGAVGEISGVACAQAAISGAHVEGDATNNRAELRLTSVGTVAEVWHFSFTYALPN